MLGSPLPRPPLFPATPPEPSISRDARAPQTNDNGQGAQLLQVIDDQDAVRLLSRSPHPYHHQNFQLLHPAERLAGLGLSTPGSTPRPRSSFPQYAKESGHSSDSGTEADDEHFPKGLPAPKGRLHKGLRGRNERLSGTSTPLLSPAILEEEGRSILPSDSPGNHHTIEDVVEHRTTVERARRRREVIRRSAECLVLASLVFIWQTNIDVRIVVHRWMAEILSGYAAIFVLAGLYPVRVLFWTWRHRPRANASVWSLRIPPTFDPAPLLYPHAMVLLVSILISTDIKAVVLPNMVLALCTLPKPLIPFAQSGAFYDPVHWLVSCLPIFVFNLQGGPVESRSAGLDPEIAVLLYPMHQSLCISLHLLATTSLLTTELQLLSVGLANILWFAASPQMAILRSFLWVGGVLITLLCGHVIRWGIILARVPKWRFRRPEYYTSKTRVSWLGNLVPPIALAERILVGSDSETCRDEELSSDDNYDLRLKKMDTGLGALPSPRGNLVCFPPKPNSPDHRTANAGNNLPARRHTLPKTPSSIATAAFTSCGRRKNRSASASLKAFFSLTYWEAARRKWMYAIYVQFCIVGIIVVGVRIEVGRHALMGNEAIGWFLGYMFGDQRWFRWQVVSLNLENWIHLPPHPESGDMTCCSMGWVQHIRQCGFGEANTRLLMSLYWAAVIAVGLVVVFRLSPFYEVDTRRKVFHFMMVAMFLPATYVDPAFAALALSAVLAIFLLLDLIRASQLPPLSKPIASFLTPYVDGRDLRGPVVISHIFLLIGCAIPLWLSLASLPRTGQGVLQGWEVPTREVSMVSGVVCVGLGDAAASLIGRRWGHRKWLWGGGKSLEGSLAFTLAVFVGLMFSTLWLGVGSWPTNSGSNLPWIIATKNSGVCASMASLTEAVLTGGNDNVIVPVVLWTCVKSLGV